MHQPYVFKMGGGDPNASWQTSKPIQFRTLDLSAWAAARVFSLYTNGRCAQAVQEGPEHPLFWGCYALGAPRTGTVRPWKRAVFPYADLRPIYAGLHNAFLSGDVFGEPTATADVVSAVLPATETADGKDGDNTDFAENVFRKINVDPLSADYGAGPTGLFPKQRLHIGETNKDASGAVSADARKLQAMRAFAYFMSASPAAIGRQSTALNALVATEPPEESGFSLWSLLTGSLELLGLVWGNIQSAIIWIVEMIIKYILTPLVKLLLFNLCGVVVMTLIIFYPLVPMLFMLNSMHGVVVSWCRTLVWVALWPTFAILGEVIVAQSSSLLPNGGFSTSVEQTLMGNMMRIAALAVGLTFMASSPAVSGTVLTAASNGFASLASSMYGSAMKAAFAAVAVATAAAGGMVVGGMLATKGGGALLKKGATALGAGKLVEGAGKLAGKGVSAVSKGAQQLAKTRVGGAALAAGRQVVDAAMTKDATGTRGITRTMRQGAEMLESFDSSGQMAAGRRFGQQASSNMDTTQRLGQTAGSSALAHDRAHRLETAGRSGTAAPADVARSSEKLLQQARNESGRSGPSTGMAEQLTRASEGTLAAARRAPPGVERQRLLHLAQALQGEADEQLGSLDEMQRQGRRRPTRQEVRRQEAARVQQAMATQESDSLAVEEGLLSQPQARERAKDRVAVLEQGMRRALQLGDVGMAADYQMALGAHHHQQAQLTTDPAERGQMRQRGNSYYAASADLHQRRGDVGKQLRATQEWAETGDVAGVQAAEAALALPGAAETREGRVAKVAMAARYMDARSPAAQEVLQDLPAAVAAYRAGDKPGMSGRLAAVPATARLEPLLAALASLDSTSDVQAVGAQIQGARQRGQPLSSRDIFDAVARRHQLSAERQGAQRPGAQAQAEVDPSRSEGTIG
jgi:phage shock protein A